MYIINASLCDSKSFSERNCSWDLFQEQGENNINIMSVLKMD